jgi:hypothetical protein
MMMNRAERHLAESIVYLSTLLADRPRLIDRYIDYFGETPQCARDAGMGSPRGIGSRANNTRFPSGDQEEPR